MLEHTRVNDQSIVFIIDDDRSVRESLESLVCSVGLTARLFETPNQFIAGAIPDIPSCLVLDVRLPNLSGLEFQAELAKAKIQIPIIFITGHGDVPMCARAMKAGAIEFLTKPFRDQDLLDAIQVALQRDKMRLENEHCAADLQTRFDMLSSREKEVLSLITAGRMNKQVAAELGISEVTVKLHRGNVMRKMAVRSFAELVKTVDFLQVERNN